MNYIKTDSSRWVKKHNENCFTIIEVSYYRDYYVQYTEVDLTEYSKDDILDEMNMSCDSFSYFKKDHHEDWKQIVAETITNNTEVDREFDDSFEDESEVYDYLMENYGINYFE